MDPEALCAAVAEDRAAGWLPFAVSATVGTTSTTSVDPVPAIAVLCAREGLWLHVDAAYAGAAAILPSHRWCLRGCEEADSLVMNPHKWLFTPIDASALYTRRPEVMRRAFQLVPDYLTSEESTPNLMDYGVQLGRRFRALKLWWVIRAFGVEGIRSRLAEHIRLAQLFTSWVEGDSRFERLAPVPFSTVCFRAVGTSADSRGAKANEGLRGRGADAGEPEGRGADPGADDNRLDALNERLLDRVNRDGKVFLSHTKLRGRYSLRLAIGNLRTEERHVRTAWDVVRAALEAEAG